MEVDGARLEIVEYRGRDDLAPLVFLHEGLGCVERWRSFPADVVAATGRRAVVYGPATDDLTRRPCPGRSATCTTRP